jgi:DNA helicase IV
VLADYMPDCPVCGAEVVFVSSGGEPGRDRFRCDVCEPPRLFRAGDLIGDARAQELRSIHDSVVARNVAPVEQSGRVGDTTYAHVVVDEAQDLSAMQWRSIVRRCPSLSMTVAGDQGQAIRPGGTGSWDAAADAIGAPSFELAELTVNYRTPIEVMEAAEAVLAAARIEYSSTRSVRSTAPPAVDELDAISVGDVRAAVDAASVVDGTLAVVAPRAMAASLAEVGVTVLDVHEAKGLEFDAVVVVDPDAIAAEGEGGARRVYVAMTRTTNVLRVLRRRLAA